MLSRATSFLLCAAFVLLHTGSVFAADLADGLDKGDGFSFGETLKGKTNTKFHQAKARGIKKGAGGGDDVVITGEDGNTNIGSVVDSEVGGNVYIFMEDNETTVVR